MWKRQRNQPGVTADPWTSLGYSSSLTLDPEANRLAELALQLEDLLDQVWRCEKDWRLDDRISLACRMLPADGRARGARGLSVGRSAQGWSSSWRELAMADIALDGGQQTGAAVRRPPKTPLR